MRPKISKVLPIAIAMLIPVIGFYTRPDFEVQDDAGFLERWIITSTTLYITWILMWRISNLNRAQKYKWYILLGIILIIGMYGSNYLLNIPFQFHYFIRVLFMMLLIFIIQYGLRSQQNISGLLLEKEQLQTENYKAQLKVLQNLLKN